jgi:3-oxoacyl-[acyl-carrier protein] reductase
VALVTGAGRGIGRAIAVRLAREGVQVIVNDVDLHAAEETANQIVGATPIRADVADRTDVHRLIHEVITRFGRIDILVNNAGVFSSAPISRMTEAEWDRVIAVNLKSVFLCSQTVFDYMKRQRSGRIVNIASLAAKVGGVFAGANYAASKAGVVCLTKSLAKQLARYGVTVNAVAPGLSRQT